MTSTSRLPGPLPSKTLMLMVGTAAGSSTASAMAPAPSATAVLPIAPVRTENDPVSSSAARPQLATWSLCWMKTSARKSAAITTKIHQDTASPVTATGRVYAVSSTRPDSGARRRVQAMTSTRSTTRVPPMSSSGCTGGTPGCTGAAKARDDSTASWTAMTKVSTLAGVGNGDPVVVPSTSSAPRTSWPATMAASGRRAQRARAPRPPSTTPMKRRGMATSAKSAVSTRHDSTVVHAASIAMPAMRSWWGRLLQVPLIGRLPAARRPGSSAGPGPARPRRGGRAAPASPSATPRR